MALVHNVRRRQVPWSQIVALNQRTPAAHGDPGWPQVFGMHVSCDALDVARALTFGDDGDGGLGDRLIDAVLRGEKTATSSLAVGYGTQDRLPRVGERWTVLDRQGTARCTVETTSVTIAPLHLVGDDVARAEGEGFAGVLEWRTEHVAFWTRLSDLIRTEIGDPSWQLREDEPVVVHWFRLIGDH